MLWTHSNFWLWRNKLSTSLTDLFTQTPSRLLWEASSRMLQLMREGCSYTYPPLSIARYSFIQLSELEQCRVKKLAQGFNTAPRIRTRVIVVESPKLYHWATALYNYYTLLSVYTWCVSCDFRASSTIHCDCWLSCLNMTWHQLVEDLFAQLSQQLCDRNKQRILSLPPSSVQRVEAADWLSVAAVFNKVLSSSARRMYCFTWDSITYTETDNNLHWDWQQPTLRLTTTYTETDNNLHWDWQQLTLRLTTTYTETDNNLHWDWQQLTLRLTTTYTETDNNLHWDWQQLTLRLTTTYTETDNNLHWDWQQLTLSTDNNLHWDWQQLTLRLTTTYTETDNNLHWALTTAIINYRTISQTP